ncbi:hypothetical protein [Macrococcus capreoli]|uniref:hypothetical protein n=1 Tax=Macrococcus capreoli TaxID=2982690 RepID=UPI0021D5DD1C|nr:hypothetical protein [Macrococcus sp. TMW 2.2395]MCU7558624.1 hypothetical protein [Macrococcus sp. TMW 2.2395]
MENHDSRLSLEETIIPYDDSFDLEKNNEIDYILRLQRPYSFEKQSLISRTSRYDNIDLGRLNSELKDLIEWFHSTVYNLNLEILSDENNIIKDLSMSVADKVFQNMRENIESINLHLMLCDIYVLKNGGIYKYLLAQNIFIKMYNYNNEDLPFIQEYEKKWQEQAEEIICIVANPKRIAILLGEKSYQESLIKAGELFYILQNLISGLKLGIKVREIKNFYDLDWLKLLGYEDNSKIITHILELHKIRDEEIG